MALPKASRLLGTSGFLRRRRQTGRIAGARLKPLPPDVRFIDTSKARKLESKREYPCLYASGLLVRPPRWPSG